MISYLSKEFIHNHLDAKVWNSGERYIVLETRESASIGDAEELEFPPAGHRGRR
jgi:hypothetical protein